jgi:hypothetical protein
MNAIGEEGRKRWLAQEAQREAWQTAEVADLSEAARSVTDASLRRILADVAAARALKWDKATREFQAPDLPQAQQSEDAAP